MKPAVLLSCLFVAACSGSPQMDSIALGTARPATAASPSASSTPVLEVSRVMLPHWLDTTDIVVGTAGGVIEVSRDARWAERLSVGVTRVLAGELRERFVVVTVYQAPAPIQPEYRLVTQIDQLGCYQNVCALEARWTLVDRDGAIVATGQTASSEPLQGTSTPRLQAEWIETQIGLVADDAQRHLIARLAPDA